MGDRKFDARHRDARGARRVARRASFERTRRLTYRPSSPLRAQAAVVAATTLAMSSPAFAATIKLGGDNGELGFFVRARRRDALDATRALSSISRGKRYGPREGGRW